MRTVFYTATSLDGFIATPEHSLDWLLQFDDPEGSSYPDFIQGVGAIAMGSGTYAWLLREHLRLGTPLAQPWPYQQPTWLFSSRSWELPEGADIRLAGGDVRPVHAAMRAAAGEQDLWIAGGGDLAGQFLDAGLLDELIVQVAPVTLGAGRPLFPRRQAFPPLELLAVERFGQGFVELRYGVAGRSGGAGAVGGDQAV